MPDANPRLEHLAVMDLTVRFPDGTLDEIADLVLRLNQHTARKNGALLNPHQQRAYLELRETERLGMRSAVKHVLNALLLLNLVELREP